MKKIWLGAIYTKYVVNIKFKKTPRFCTKSELNCDFYIKCRRRSFNFYRMVSVDCTTSVKKTYIGIVSFSPQTKLILYKSKKWGGVMTKRTSRFCFKLSNYTILVNFNLSQDSEFESLPSLPLPNPLYIRAYSIIKYTVIYF